MGSMKQLVLGEKLSEVSTRKYDVRGKRAILEQSGTEVLIQEANSL